MLFLFISDMYAISLGMGCLRQFELRQALPKCLQVKHGDLDTSYLPKQLAFHLILCGMHQ